MIWIAARMSRIHSRYFIQPILDSYAAGARECPRRGVDVGDVNAEVAGEMRVNAKRQAIHFDSSFSNAGQPV